MRGLRCGSIFRRQPHQSDVEVAEDGHAGGRSPSEGCGPGPVTLEIKQFGMEKPDKLTLMAYSEAASLDRLTVSSGDMAAVLTGTRLDEVAKASLNKIVWMPSALKRVQDVDQLELKTEAPTADLEPGKHYFATVELRDGRKLRAPVRVDPPRPEIILLSKGTQDEASAEPSPVRRAARMICRLNSAWSSF